MNIKNKWLAFLSILSVIFIILAAVLFWHTIFNAETDNQLFMSIIFILVGFSYLFNSVIRLKGPDNQNNRFKTSWFYFNLALSGILIVGSVIRIIIIFW